MIVDAFQDGLGSVELDEQHDEDAMVGQLLEVCVANLVVLKQHTRHDAQHLANTTTLTAGGVGGEQHTAGQDLSLVCK